MNTLHDSVERILALLQQLQPVVGEYDIVWHGPYYIPRCGDWHPSTFMLYRGRLFASLYIAPHWHGLSWLVGSDAVDMERCFSVGTNSLGEQVWQDALETRARDEANRTTSSGQRHDARAIFRGRGDRLRLRIQRAAGPVGA